MSGDGSTKNAQEASDRRLVEEKKQILKTLLQDKFDNYLDLLQQKLRFSCQKLTQDEFDSQVLEICTTTEARKSHIEFLKVLFLGGDEKKNEIPMAMQPSHEQINEEYVDEYGKSLLMIKEEPMDISEDQDPKPVKKEPTTRIQWKPQKLGKYIPLSTGDSDHFDKNEIHFQDSSDVLLVYGRMKILAWKEQLSYVEENAAKLLVSAVYDQLRTMLMSLVTRRHSYQVRESKFQYGFGCPQVNVFLQNSDQTNQINGMQVMRKGVTSNTKSSKKPCNNKNIFKNVYDSEMGKDCLPLSAWDLFDALQLYPGTIPNHSVYAPFMEKVICKLNHLSEEELKLKCQQEQDLRKSQLSKERHSKQRALENLYARQIERKSLLDSRALRKSSVQNYSVL